METNSLKRQSRFAAFLYILQCLPAPFASVYVPNTLIVPGDAAATANHLRAFCATAIAGFGYVLSSFISLFLPPSARSSVDLALLLGIGELAFFRLLIWGAKEQPGRQAMGAHATT